MITAAAEQKKPTPAASFDERADRLVSIAEQAFEDAETYHDVWNSVFGIAGPAAELFPDREGRERFRRTEQYRRIVELIGDLRGRETDDLPNGKVLVRLPRSLHAALLAEADREGTSLNQLCVSKLSATLRERAA